MNNLIGEPCKRELFGADVDIRDIRDWNTSPAASSGQQQPERRELSRYLAWSQY